MASSVVPFNEAKVPAHIAALFGAVSNSEYVSGSSSVPSVSFRGKVWRIVIDGDENVLTVPGTDDPAPTMEVVLLKGNPNKSKTYYGDKKYVEGEQTEPVCASRDGIKPDANAVEPQCETCAACPHNVWGSRISENGKKVKACADSKRIAVVPAGDLSFTPLKLSVPAASLSDKDNKENEAKGWYALAEYANFLGKKGVPVEAVVTKIGFDSRPAYPKLLFKVVGYLDEEQSEKVVELRESDTVNEIIGVLAPNTSPAVKAAVPPVVAKPKAEKPKAVVKQDEDDAPPETTSHAVEEDAPPAAPVKKAAKPKAEPVVEVEVEASTALKDKVASILGSMGLDDDDD